MTCREVILVTSRTSAGAGDELAFGSCAIRSCGGQLQTITIPDEGTLLLGGQRLITEVEVESGVPVLSKIPILNRFFTNRIETKEEQSLLILCKPTILIQTEEEEKQFPGVNDQIRSGLGLR